MVLPFFLLPYLTSLAVWLAATLAVFLIVLWRIGPHPLIFLLTLAFPGTFINFICGQNGFLSAAFLGSGLLLLDRFPLAAGLLLGLLCFKPHLALLVPVALLAGRHWKALIGSLLSALALSGASVSVFGWTVWGAFWHNLPFALKLIGNDAVPLQKMPSVFAAVLSLGGGVLLAWILQATVMICVTAAVAWVWVRGAPPAMRNALLVLGLLLFPAYIFDYDLAILALPLAWLAREGYRKMYLLGEPILLTLGWLLPLVFLPLRTTGIGLPLGPLVLGALFIFTLYRAITSTRVSIPNNQDET
jgi:hypothetical protein